MTASLNPALRDFWTTPARNRVLYGGRASSKSHDAAGFAVFLAHNYKVKFMCARQFQNKIADSVYSLLKDKIEAFGLKGSFKITENSIIHLRTGSEFLFYGIARNLNEIKSTEGVDVLWLEEAHALTKNQWEILEPTIRKEGSQVWVIFNPAFASDFAYQTFVVNPPPNTIVRKINYTENCFLSSTMVNVIEAAKAKSEQEGSDDFEHIYLGVPRSDDDRVVIKRSWIEAALDAHLKLGFEPEGASVIGFDVADDGADKCANVHVHGSVALWSDEWRGKEDELLKSCSRTYQQAVTRKALIRYDSIGVGAHAGAKFDELNDGKSTRVNYEKFNAGGAVFKPDSDYLADRMTRVLNKDHFSNIKAQTWWLVADRFRNTYDAIKNGTKYPVDEMISISSDMPNLEKLMTELSTPRRDFDRNGRVKVESKEDMAKPNREGGPQPSPNIADAFVMCFAPMVHAMKINKSALSMAMRRR
nr:MAG: terminase large subunit [Caudoviricetes sp.]